ncbi:MAG: relaxase/mobilization nuclease domain-containing protein [Cyanobacteria bacterium P01_F01_bin.53]
MIIKSSQRSGRKSLANHLTKVIDFDGVEQEIIVSDSRNLALHYDVHEALQCMEFMSQLSSRVEKHMYHISVSPAEELDEEQWGRAWWAYEAEFGLSDHPFIEVTHIKKGRIHKHRVYERVDTDTCKAIELSFTRIRNEKVSRILEHQFGHDLTVGKHNRTVIKQLAEEGQHAIVAWMRGEHAHEVERPVAEMDYQDHQQTWRTKVSKAQVKADLCEAWERTDNGAAFEAAIAEKGLLLVRGDRQTKLTDDDGTVRRVPSFVVMDWTGGTHSPRRLIGVKVAELHARWADVNPAHLLTVEGQRLALQQEHITEDEEASTKPTETNTAVLAAMMTGIDREIAQLENQLALETPLMTAVAAVGYTANWTAMDASQRTPTAPPPANDQAQVFDHRGLVEEQQHWQQTADQERSRPQDDRFSNSDPISWGLHSNTLRVMMTYDTESARQERERRIDVALKVANTQSKKTATPLMRYVRLLGEHVSQRGRSSYRLADRFLAERLARLGYSRGQLRRVLAQASPGLMAYQPSQRVSYINQLVNRVYQKIEQQRIQRQERDGKKVKAPDRPILKRQPASQKTGKPEHQQSRLPANDNRPPEPPRPSLPGR